MCTAIEITISGGGVQTYNGIYNRQSTTINGYDWWMARNDVGEIDANTGATMYFSTSHNRWIIEATDQVLPPT